MKKLAFKVLVLILLFCLAGLVRANKYDLYLDGKIDLKDLNLFTEQWLSQDCAADSWCDGADFDESNGVDLVDFSLFAQNWKQPISLSTEYYVATDGNDNDAGTIGAPWATIGYAADQMSPGDTCYIRGGTYYISSTIVFDNNDSGTIGNPVTFKAYEGEDPVFIGGEVITGWVDDTSSIVKAYISDVDNDTWRFDQLFEDGVRKRKARVPNSSVGYKNTSAGPSETKVGFYTLPTWAPDEYADAQVVIWGSAKWWQSTVPIQDINYTTERITFTHAVQNGTSTGDPYYIQGIKAELDEPGEFFLDEPNGYLYYWPTVSDINEVTMIAPRVDNVFEFIGADGNTPAEYIILDGLTIACSKFTFTYREAGYNEGLHNASNRPGAENRKGLVRMENASNITVNNCKLLNAGHCGVAMATYSSYNTVSGCEIFKPGSHGVLLTGTNQGHGVSTDPNQQVNDNKFNTVYNNHIHKVGKLAGCAGGVMTYQSSDNLIQHNEVHDSDRYGIAMKNRGGMPNFESFGDVNNSKDILHHLFTSNNNLIQYNHVYDCLEDSYDAGAISLKMPGMYNTVDNNRIHDIRPPTGWQTYAFGIYLDGGTEETTITNNVIYGIRSNTSNGTYPINVKKYHNILDNNIFIHEPAGVGRGNIMTQIGSTGWSLSENYGSHEYSHNILYSHDTGDVFYRFHESEWACTLLTSSNNNLFYQPSGTKVFEGIPGSDNWTVWKTVCSDKYDNDTSSSDPLFADIGNDDYNISQSSPAYNKGFVEIDQNLPGLDEQAAVKILNTLVIGKLGNYPLDF